MSRCREERALRRSRTLVGYLAVRNFVQEHILHLVLHQDTHQCFPAIDTSSI